MLAELTGEGMSDCCRATDELELCAPERKGHMERKGSGDFEFGDVEGWH